MMVQRNADQPALIVDKMNFSGNKILTIRIINMKYKIIGE
jgi:hypothetical protein